MIDKKYFVRTNDQIVILSRTKDMYLELLKIMLNDILYPNQSS